MKNACNFKGFSVLGITWKLCSGQKLPWHTIIFVENYAPAMNYYEAAEKCNSFGAKLISASDVTLDSCAARARATRGYPTWKWHLPLDIVKNSLFPLWEASRIVGRNPTQFVTESVISSGLFQIFVSNKPCDCVKTMFFLYDVHANFMEPVPLMRVRKSDENTVNSWK